MTEKKSIRDSIPKPERFHVIMQKGSHSSHMQIPEYMELYQEGLYHVRMMDAADRRARFFHLTQLLRLTRGVKGETAEAGVFRGLSSWLICKVLQEENPDFKGENHLMIDSFEGLSEPVEKDGAFPLKRFNEGGFTQTSVERVQKSLSDFPDVEIHKGWIPDVFEKIPRKQYRFVHVDVDVYEPTLASLRFFYEQLAPGAIIVVDDYGPWEGQNWPGCIKAVEEFAEEIGQPFAILETGNVFFIKR